MSAVHFGCEKVVRCLLEAKADWAKAWAAEVCGRVCFMFFVCFWSVCLFFVCFLFHVSVFFEEFIVLIYFCYLRK